MSGINAIALFAEDFRQDVNGTTLLIGIIPDGMLFASFPAVLPKLVAYAKINVPLSFEPRPISVFMRGPGLPEVKIGDFTPEVIKNGQSLAAENEAPFLGLICVSMATPAAISEAGHIVVDMVIDNQITQIGDLFVQQIQQTDAPDFAAS